MESLATILPMNSYLEGKYNAARHYGLLPDFDAQEILDCGSCNSPARMKSHPHFFCKYYQASQRLYFSKQFLRYLFPSVKRAKDKKVTREDRNMHITIDKNRYKVDGKRKRRKAGQWKA